ncbi:MAG: hypothetical protein R3277_09755 [Brumimicrobium sp.]|nr:hypothetical protein [Brumimicrobium sp.]
MKFLSVLLLLTTVMVGFSCKYEEGPAISLRTKKARLVNVWKIEKEIDADGTVENDPAPGVTLEFKKDNTFIFSNGNMSSTGTWEFSSDKENLITTYSSGNFSFSESTKILRLANDELWLQDNDNDETHYVPA